MTIFNTVKHLNQIMKLFKTESFNELWENLAKLNKNEERLDDFKFFRLFLFVNT